MTGAAKVLKVWPKGRLSSRQRGYTWKWEKARRFFLRQNPLCRTCERQGFVTQANVVDHIIPHGGNSDLFWDQDNWQSLCYSCHNRHKQREEKGLIQILDEDGWPQGY